MSSIQYSLSFMRQSCDILSKHLQKHEKLRTSEHSHQVHKIEVKVNEDMHFITNAKLIQILSVQRAELICKLTWTLSLVWCSIPDWSIGK